MTAVPTPTRGLGPAFGNVFVSNLASSLGTGIAVTAIPLLAVRLTSDPLLISGIAALVMLPWLLLAIPSGMLVDRIDRRLALGIANAVRCVLALALFVMTLTGLLNIWVLYAIVFLFGAAETVYDGALRAVIPAIVVKERLPTANGRVEAGEVVAQNFAAAPLTSWLFGLTALWALSYNSALIALGINVAAFVLAVVLAVLLPAQAGRAHLAARAAEKSEPWFRQIAEGFRFIVSKRMLVGLWLISTATGIAFQAATSSFVLFITVKAGLPVEYFGAFLLTGAVGAIAGSLVVPALRKRFPNGVLMATANLVSGVATLFVGLVPTIWGAAIGFALTSFAITIWNVLVISLRQSIIPARLLGRVHGTWRTLLWGAMPVGSLLGGLLARIDLATPFLVGGGVAALIGIVFFPFLRRLPNPEDVSADNEPGPVADEGPADVASPITPIVED